MKSETKDLSGQVRALITRIKLEGTISGRLLVIEQALMRGELSEEEANQLAADEHGTRESWERVFEKVGLDHAPFKAEERTPAVTMPAPAPAKASIAELSTAVAAELHKLVWSAPRRRIEDPNWPNYKDRAELV